MRQLSAVLFVAVPLAACGGGGGSANPDAHVVVMPDAAPDALILPPDAPAPVYDFSCEPNPAPTTATATVTISGTAQGLTISGLSPSVNPLPGATIDMCKGDCLTTNKLDTQTSATDGTFTSAAISTGSLPLSGYVKTSKTGYRTANVYPAGPIIADFPNVPALTFSTGAFSTLAGLAGATQDAGKGDTDLIITDCVNTPIDGATISVKQGGTAVAGTTVLDLSQFSAMAAGTFIIFNVPPGDTEVGATYMGHTLRAHTVLSVAGQTTATLVKPGF